MQDTFQHIARNAQAGGHGWSANERQWFSHVYWHEFMQNWACLHCRPSIGAMQVSTTFGLSTNGFTRAFAIHQNGFTGSLPKRIMRLLTGVWSFAVHENSFTGMLEDSCISAMRAVSYFNINTNGFSGALPDGGIL
eukprot:5339466-Amphidinium_carterae.3